ncbi:GtrA family protein [Candidatus Kaiserbacteria bacterium]|nr:MAG: GtrA family protein [Candidatus Kaiserbacteria bacterium]
MSPFLHNLFLRGYRYGVVGVGTYLFDLLIVYTLTTYTPLPLFGTIFIGFLIAISINYSISYHWAFAGTTTRPLRGYFFFILVALAAGTGIAYSTTLLVDTFALPLVVSRTLVAGVIGTLSFILNARFNFHVL